MNLGKNIKFIPIADESLGVRSMAAVLKTSDVKIFFDPGLSLAPRRYGLPPHPVEMEVASQLRERILLEVEDADIVTISHYHRDHYTPPHESKFEHTTENTFLEIYSGKIILAKDYTHNINYNQRKRAYVLFKKLGDQAKEIVFADNREYVIGETRIEAFLSPHGVENSKLGWVLGFLVKVHNKPVVMYLPDVQGPISQNVLKKVLEIKPYLLVIGGPPTYLSGTKVKQKDVLKGLQNLKTLVQELKREGRQIVISHHLLRDKEWTEILSQYGIEESNVKLYSDILNKKFTGLEAYRDTLFEVEKPSPEYFQWIQGK